MRQPMSPSEEKHVKECEMALRNGTEQREVDCLVCKTTHPVLVRLGGDYIPCPNASRNPVFMEPSRRQMRAMGFKGYEEPTPEPQRE